MSNYDALASFILLCVPLVALVQLLNWWFCPLDEEVSKSGQTSTAASSPVEG